MLKPTAFANAATVTGAILFVVCRLLVGAMPNVMFNVAQSWMHSADLQSSMMGGYGTASTWFTGLIAMVVVVWLAAYLFATLYNSWEK